MVDKIYSIDEIKNIIAPIAIRHGLDRVYLFGSYAKGTANGRSDIDLCVDASKLKGLFTLGRLYADFEDAFGKELDLITTKSLQHSTDYNFLQNLMNERILVYEST